MALNVKADVVLQREALMKQRREKRLFKCFRKGRGCSRRFDIPSRLFMEKSSVDYLAQVTPGDTGEEAKKG
ncbi:hypothetical protein CC1G_15202 [Coprinopsis cinerea okayama7|uniref:Uncharacterized protein n=1 Tax=Coprinopsis cinerea (strain Okayama-7 / 130 / ATCC MYA-4618 / FGSC 9003) TaxID=240176 RepID=D6RPT5_COPC7|nr:hypothetical protein CC1G_15202 [Coprinopsis cinerea okayama7\|eukprot:XP_002910567.1 hypothetical protein CC1G_15202 [Coprinopsis cinerea okayama7\